MDIRQITPRYFVAPQIDATDMTALAEAGFTTVIDNRPDAEIDVDQQADVMAQAADAAGLKFVLNELTMNTMTPERQAVQRDTLEQSDGKVLAYCRSGTRSTICWALAHAQTTPVDDLLSAAADGGYDLSGLAPSLHAIAKGS
ncbi:TIGR01244 family sulfur transferase [Shimia sp.]|uniref:TIGR01244 family sulfur transferase n=1 Tax=Shimia sp. TaxID=1954381 RepID=UPI0032977FB3